MKKYIFGLIVLLFFVNIGYSLTVSVVTNCTNFYLNINRSKIYNDSLIKVFYFSSSGRVQILSAWMNGTNDTYNFSLTLPPDYVNYTIVVNESDFNLSNGILLNVNNDTEVVVLDWNYLNITANTTVDYSLDSFYVNLSLSSNNTNLTYTSPTSIKVLNNCFVTIHPDTNTIYNKRSLYGLYLAGVFYPATGLPVSKNITTNSSLILVYKTLLNNSKINISKINGVVLPNNTTYLPNNIVYVPYGTAYTITVNLSDEHNQPIKSSVYLILNSTNVSGTTTLYSGLNNTSYLNETVVSTVYTSYKAVVNYSLVYNNTTIGPFNVTPSRTWYIVGSNKLFLNLSNRTLSCRFISEYGWNYVKKLLNTTVFYLKNGTYNNTICNSSFFDLNGINNLTLIGLYRTKVIISGTSDIILSVNNSSNITLYNVTVNPTSASYVIYLENSSNINISNDNISGTSDIILSVNNSSNININNDIIHGNGLSVKSVIYLENSPNININSSNIYVDGLVIGPIYEIYSVNSSLNIYNTKMNVNIIAGGELYDIYSIDSKVNLLNDNLSTEYYYNNSTLIEGIYSQNSSVNVNSSTFYDLKVGIYLNKPSYVNVSNTKFYNDKYTIYSEDPSSYLTLYTSNDSVEDGTYTGYIITVRNSPDVYVYNRTYNGKYVFKLIVINSSDVFIETIGNTSTNKIYEYGYDKIILLNVTNALVYNTTIINTEKGIVVWPNISELYLNYVYYSPLDVLYLPNTQTLEVNNSIFNVNGSMIILNNTNVPGIYQYIYIKNTSFIFKTNGTVLLLNSTENIYEYLILDYISINTSSWISNIIEYNNPYGVDNGYVIIINSTIKNTINAVLFNSDVGTKFASVILFNNDTMSNVLNVLNINDYNITSSSYIFINNSIFNDIGHILEINNDTENISLIAPINMIYVYNDSINRANYIFSINNSVAVFNLYCDKLNISNVKYFVGYAYNNSEALWLYFNDSTVNYSTHGIFVNNSANTYINNDVFKNINGKAIVVENNSGAIYGNTIITASVFSNVTNSVIISESSPIEIENVVINNSTYGITAINAINSTVEIGNTSILDNNIENAIVLKYCNNSNLSFVTISGNNFQGIASSGITYEDSHNILLDNINVNENNNLDIAVYLYYINNTTINHVNVENGKYGIEFDSVNSLKMENITMSNLDYGFYEILPSNYFLIYNSVLKYINISGIYLSGPSNFTINKINVTNVGHSKLIAVADGKYILTSYPIPAKFLVYGSTATNGSCIYITSGKNGTIENITLSRDDFNGVFVSNSSSINISNINASDYCKTFDFFEVRTTLVTGPIILNKSIEPYLSATCGSVIKIYDKCLDINVNNVYGSTVSNLVDIEGNSIENPTNINIININGTNIAPLQYINNSTKTYWVSYILPSFSNYFFKNYYKVKDGLARRPGYAIIIKNAKNISVEDVNINNIGKGFVKIDNSINVLLGNTNSNLSEIGFNGTYYPLAVDIENSTSVNIRNSTYSSFLVYGIYIYNLTGESEFFNNILYIKNNSSTIGLYITNSTPVYLKIKYTDIINQNLYKYGSAAIIRYSENITLDNDNLTKTYYGLYIDNSSNIELLNSTILKNTIALRIFYSKGILVNNTYFNLSYIGIWVIALLGEFNLNINYFYNTTYPVFIDANNRPPTNITNLSYFDTGSDYVVNYVNNSLVSGYIVCLKNITSLNITNNICYSPPCTGKRIYALYLYNATTASNLITIQNSQFIGNGNGILAEDIYGVNFINNSFQFNLIGISIYNSNSITLSYNKFYKNKYYTMFIYNLKNSSILNTKINYTRVTEIDNSLHLYIYNITVFNNNETGLKFSNDRNIIFEKFNFSGIGVPMKYWLGITHQIKYPILDLRIINTPNITIKKGIFKHKNGAYTSNLVTHCNSIEYNNIVFSGTSTGIAMSFTNNAKILNSVFKYNLVGVLLFTFTFRKFTTNASLINWYNIAVTKGYFFRGDNNTILENDTFERNLIGLKINGVNYTFVNDSDFENNTQSAIEIQARLWGISNYSCGSYYFVTRVFQPNYYVKIYDDKFYNNNNALNIIDYTEKTKLIYTTKITCPPNPNSLKVIYVNVKVPHYPDNVILSNDNISYNNYGVKTDAMSKLYIEDTVLYKNNNASLLKYSTNMYLSNDKIISQKISGIKAISVGGVFLIDYCNMSYNPKTLVLINPTGYYKISNSGINYTPDNVTNINCTSSKVGNFIVDNVIAEHDNGSFIYGLLNVYSDLKIDNSQFEYDNGSIVINNGYVGNLYFDGNTVYKIKGSVIYLRTTRPFAVVNVSNNKITDISGYGIYIRGANGDNITLLNVTGNSFTNVGGIGFKSTEQIIGNVNISKNIVNNVNYYFAYITGFNAPRNYTYIFSNTIKNCDNGIYLSGRIGKLNINNDNEILYNNGFGIKAVGSVHGLSIETSNISYDNGTGVYVQNVSSGNIDINQNYFINDNGTGVYIGTNGPANINMQINVFMKNNIGFYMYCYKPFGNLSVSENEFYYNNVSAVNITCPDVYNGSINNIVVKYTKYALGSALALSLSNTTISYTNVINNTGTGITIFNSYNLTMENGDVIRNNTGNGMNIFNTNDSSFIVTSIFNQGYGVYVAYSSITFNQSNISWNGNYGVNVISLFSNQRVFFNYSYICYNLNGESYDIENLNYTTSFLAVLHSQFGITNPTNPYQTFFVANQYLNAYPDDDYFCNATKQGFGNNVGAGKITNISTVKIPFLPKATSYVMVVKGTDVGAVVLAKTVVFRPFCPMPKIMGSGKYILIINKGRVTIA